MKSKKKLLESCRLYVILDNDVCGHKSIFDIAGEINSPGVDIIQYRNKTSPREKILEDSARLRKLLSNSRTLFIINDYLDIAKIVDSDGLHIGQNDISAGLARKILGKEKIIGVSCHTLGQALCAQEQGADYISVGPVFKTPTKPEYKAVGLGLIKAALKYVKTPFFAIGGINAKAISELQTLGAKRFAVCRAVCKAKIFSFAIKNLRDSLSR